MFIAGDPGRLILNFNKIPTFCCYCESDISAQSYFIVTLVVQKILYLSPLSR